MSRIVDWIPSGFSQSPGPTLQPSRIGSVLGPVVEDDATGSFVPGSTGNANRSIVHRIGGSPFYRLCVVFGQDRGIEIVLAAKPDSGKSVEWFHTVLIPRVRPADFAKRIRNRRCVSHWVW